MHRFVILLFVLLPLAGCVGNDETAPTPSSPAPTSPTSGSPVVITDPTDELVGPVTSRLALASGYTMTTYAPGLSLEETEEAERVPPTALYGGLAGQAIVIPPWVGPASANAVEIIGSMPMLLKYRASAKATETTPRAAEIPPAGGWFGTADRWSHLTFFSGAPAQLEPGQTVAISHTFEMPPGGYFLRPGEAFAPHMFLAYQTADNTPVRYVLGGDDPAGFTMTVRPVMLPPTTAVEILAKAGTVEPNPGFSTEGDRGNQEFPLSVPAGTQYIVAEVSGSPSAAGTTYDLDLTLLAGGQSFAKSSGPTAKEVIVLGPGNLKATGNELVLRVASASFSGGSFSVTVTAYVAAS